MEIYNSILNLRQHSHRVILTKQHTQKGNDKHLVPNSISHTNFVDIFLLLPLAVIKLH